MTHQRVDSPRPETQLDRAIKKCRTSSGRHANLIRFELWPCPALFCYFIEAPRRIYLRAEP